MGASGADSSAERGRYRADPLALAAVAFGLVAVIVLVLALLIAIALPYGDWDAMSYGTWSRLIGLHWMHLRFAGVIAVQYQRPLFYVLQGELWAAFGFHQWIGRLLSYLFSCVLVASTAWLAAQTVRVERRFAAVLAVVVVLITEPFEHYVAAGLTDIPVAAMVALTGAVLVTPRLGRAWLPFVGLAATLSVLTKPSALPALAGLGLAILIGPRADLRRRAFALVALAAGTGIGLAYDAVQAGYLHMGLRAFLTSGVTDAPYYENLASALRRTTLLDGSWLGADLRLFLAFAVLYALARLARLAHRPAVAVALPVAAVWSWLGPHLAGAHGVRVGILGTGGWLEQGSLIVLALSLLFALRAPAAAVPGRTTLARGLVWASLTFISWAWKGVYDTRLLAPAWPALALLIVWSLLPAFAGARASGRALVLAPTVAALVLCAYAAYDINGLGAPGWKSLTAGGFSGLTNGTRLRDLGLGGDFAAEMDALVPQVRPHDVIATDDAKLLFFYLSQVEIIAPEHCSQLAGTRLFVLLESDEEHALYGNRADSAFWDACTNPHLTKIAERPGAFAVYVNGIPTLAGGGCGTPPPKELVVEFGEPVSTMAAAQAQLKRVVGAGFSQASVQQLGCASYRVVYTGIPGRSVGESMIAEAKSAHISAHLVGP